MNSFNELAIQSATYGLNIENDIDEQNLETEEIQKSFEKAINSKLELEIYENDDDQNVPEEKNIITNLPPHIRKLPKGTIFDYLTKIQNITPDYFQIVAKNKTFVYNKERTSVYKMEPIKGLLYDVPFLNLTAQTKQSNFHANPKNLYEMIDFTLSKESFESKYLDLLEKLPKPNYDNVMRTESLLDRYFAINSLTNSYNLNEIKEKINQKKIEKTITIEDVVMALLIQINDTNVDIYNNVDNNTINSFIKVIKEYIKEKIPSV